MVCATFIFTEEYPWEKVIPVKLESETMAEGHLKSTKKFQLLLKAIVLRAVIVS